MNKIKLLMSSVAMSAAVMMTFSCGESGNDPDDPGNKPSTTTSAGILPFVSRLSDGVLMTSDADFNAVTIMSEDWKMSVSFISTGPTEQECPMCTR